MIIVLDSNEYINFLNKKAHIEKIFGMKDLSIRIHELIVKEVLRNINESSKKEFYALLLRNDIVLNNERIPRELLNKYNQKGLKKGDIGIASFCERENADYLISENRHFLKDAKFDKFKVVKLTEFLAAGEKHSEV